MFSVEFDVPEVDLVAMLRPTMSTGNYIPQVGRGVRPAPGKTDCLILDSPAMSKGTARLTDSPCMGLALITHRAPVLVKNCPKCQSIVPLASLECPDCGYVFTDDRRISHAWSPDDDAQLIRGYLWVPVSQCEIKRWQIQDWIRPWVRITYNNDVVEHLDF